MQRSRLTFARLGGAAVGVLLLDQLSKLAILRWAPQLVTYNRNVAFSLPIPGWVTLLVLALLIGLLLRYWRALTRASQGAALAVGLVLGGALSNLLDRLLRGAVVDFINLRVWPVFNLADTAVVVGVLLVLWYAVRSSHDATSPGTGDSRRHAAREQR